MRAMATPKKLKSGKWKVEIMVSGVRESGTFESKSDALIWVAKRSTEIRAIGEGRGGDIKSLCDALRRYAKEVSVGKKGERWERIRLESFENHPLPLTKKLKSVTAADIAQWRDARLAVVSKATVSREMTIINSVFEIARKEWGWVEKNPCVDVKKPGKTDHRERVISNLEIRKMLRTMGYSKADINISNIAAHVFLLALMTGMRAGEICSLRWGDIHPNYAKIHTSKTGKGRDIPLTPTAVKVIERMRKFDKNQVFCITPSVLDTLFRRTKSKAGLAGFTFHDSRHTAATRLAQKLHVLDLCKVFGWTDTSRALTYYNPKASDLAARMI